MRRRSSSSKAHSAFLRFVAESVGFLIAVLIGFGLVVLASGRP